MTHEDDTPLSDEELAWAKRGEALIAAAVADTRAPQSLRESIERDRDRARTRRGASFWRHRRPMLAAGAMAAAVLAAVVVATQSGTSGTGEPSLAAVQRAAGLDGTGPAPARAGGEPPVLAARVGRISFPDWQGSFGWKAVGSRQDEIVGRRVKTVYYRNSEGAHLDYSIVAGEPIAERPPGRAVGHEGKTYHVAHAGDRTFVTWTQQGHTCAFVASAGVPDSRLVEIAASRNTNA